MGEDAPTVDGKLKHCSGMNVCEQFTKRFASSAGANFKEKAIEACGGCLRCDGNPPIEESSDDDIQSWVDEIFAFENFWLVERFRQKVNSDILDSLDYDSYRLFLTLRQQREAIERVQKVREQMYLKARMATGS